MTTDHEGLVQTGRGSGPMDTASQYSVPVLVRTATVDDLDAFRFVGLATWPSTYGPLAGPAFVVAGIEQYWSPEALLPALTAGMGLVATIDVDIVGVAQVDRADNDLVLWKLYVVPWRQHQGVGRQLLEAVRRRAESLELGLLTEYVTANAAAGAFYRAYGFTDTPAPGSHTGATWLRLNRHHQHETVAKLGGQDA